MNSVRLLTAFAVLMAGCASGSHDVSGSHAAFVTQGTHPEHHGSEGASNHLAFSSGHSSHHHGHGHHHHDFSDDEDSDGDSVLGQIMGLVISAVLNYFFGGDSTDSYDSGDP